METHPGTRIPPLVVMKAAYFLMMEQRVLIRLSQPPSVLPSLQNSLAAILASFVIHGFDCPTISTIPMAGPEPHGATLQHLASELSAGVAHQVLLSNFVRLQV